MTVYIYIYIHSCLLGKLMEAQHSHENTTQGYHNAGHFVSLPLLCCPSSAQTCTVKQDTGPCSRVLEEACGSVFCFSLWVLRMNASPGPAGFSPLEQMWFSVRSAGQESPQNSHTAKRFLETLLTAHFLL